MNRIRMACLCWEPVGSSASCWWSAAGTEWTIPALCRDVHDALCRARVPWRLSQSGTPKTPMLQCPSPWCIQDEKGIRHRHQNKP